MPQVTVGAMSSASDVHDVVVAGIASDANPRQRATAASHAAPSGAYGRPFR